MAPSSLASRFRLHCFAGLFALSACACTLAAAFEIEPSHRSPGLPRQYEPGSFLTPAPSSATPTGSDQWLHDDRPIPAATGSSLTLVNLTAGDCGNYRLRVTLDDGSVDHSDTEAINFLPLPPSLIDRSFSSDLPFGVSVSTIGPFASDGSMIVRYPLDAEPSSRVSVPMVAESSAASLPPPPAGFWPVSPTATCSSRKPPTGSTATAPLYPRASTPSTPRVRPVWSCSRSTPCRDHSRRGADSDRSPRRRRSPNRRPRPHL